MKNNLFVNKNACGPAARKTGAGVGKLHVPTRTAHNAVYFNRTTMAAFAAVLTASVRGHAHSNDENKTNYAHIDA